MFKKDAYVKHKGDIKSFNKNWRGRTNKRSIWFHRGEPQNQIEYAFGQHFSFIRQAAKLPRRGKCLEVGCGRGSFSAFFADHGYDVTLSDLSEGIIQDARKIFKSLKLDKKAAFDVSDALHLNFKDNTFDIVTSIGLMEHFKDPTHVIAEQVRVLKKGGIFTAYVVPKKKSMHHVFDPFNKMLRKHYAAWVTGLKKPKKVPLYRTTYGSKVYLNIMKKLRLKRVGAQGVYPYPPISYSPEFPFTVMPPYFEKALVAVFKNMEQLRSQNGKHPWACDEAIAQGFFIWGTK